MDDWVSSIHAAFTFNAVLSTTELHVLCGCGLDFVHNTFFFFSSAVCSLVTLGLLY